MTAWDNRLASHDATAHLRELASLARTEPDLADADVADEWARALRVIRYIEARWNTADGQLVTASFLDALSAPLANALAALRAFQATADAPNVKNANSYLDQALEAIARWPGPPTVSDLDSLRDAATAYRRSLGQLVRSMEADIKGLRESIGANQTVLEETASKVTASLLDAKAASDARLAELGAAVDKQSARLDTLIATYEQQFRQAENARATEAQTASASRLEATEALLKEIRTQGDEILGRLGEQEATARRVVNVIGAIAVSGGYGEYAAAQKQVADRWRLAAVGSLGIVAVLATIHALTFPVAVDIPLLLQKALLATPFLVIAGYAGTQSGRHRENERQARKLELELAALDPYIELLQDDDKRKIKTEVASRIFGQPLGPLPPDEQVGSAQLIAIISGLVGKLK